MWLLLMFCNWLRAWFIYRPRHAPPRMVGKPEPFVWDQTVPRKETPDSPPWETETSFDLRPVPRLLSQGELMALADGLVKLNKLRMAA